jgi:predicted porin
MDMIGGLMKTTSRFAIAAVAGLALGGLATTGAKAADLGGNCCADLEERVAELEATTARKGNRVVSLTISGHVNRGFLWWSDNRSDGYLVGNANSRTRFRFAGNAKLNADWTAGYYIEIGVNDTQTTDVTQLNDNGSETGLSMRHDYWYLESKTFGRITVGHTTGAADGTDVVDLGDIGVVTSAETYLHSGGLLLFDKTTGLYKSNINWTAALTGGVDPGRADVIKYDSPTWNGFQFSASWGEDDVWAVALRFANEWNGLRVAAAVGYINDLDENGGQLGVVNQVSATGLYTPNGFRDIRRWQASASLWHVPSGIFVSGSYTNTEYKGTLDRDIAGVALVPGLTRPDHQYWWIGAGLKKNWFGIGTTAIYGEYAEGEGQLDGSCYESPCTLTLRVTDHSSRLWGVGLVQNIDAIASEVYIGYRHHEVDLSTQTAAQFQAGTSTKQNIEALDSVLAGIKIKF